MQKKDYKPKKPGNTGLLLKIVALIKTADRLLRVPS
jgi:hypothetical protein